MTKPSRAAREWIEGLQSKNGGWGAFDADNAYYYLNNIPFADHGALLDPPTEDVTGRCIGMLAQLGDAPDGPRVKAAIAYLERVQLKDGSWFGRWGVNYIYGTWSALAGLNAAGADAERPMMTQRRRLADRHPERRRRLGRGLRQLPARLFRLRACALHRLADRLGAARPDGGGRGRSSRRRARHRLSAKTRRTPTGCGGRSITPAAVFRASSICAITAIRNSSRSGRVARYRNLKAGNSSAVAYGL